MLDYQHSRRCTNQATTKMHGTPLLESNTVFTACGCRHPSGCPPKVTRRHDAISQPHGRSNPTSKAVSIVFTRMGVRVSLHININIINTLFRSITAIDRSTLRNGSRIV